MSDARELAPRPPGAAHPSDPGSAVRRAKVAIACETCRLRRVKCDGAKPKCRACSAQASDCVYAAPANLLAKQQKETIEELENDKSALFEILWYLQTKSPDQATALLESLRSNQGGDMGAILQHFSQHRQEPFHANTSSDTMMHSSKQPATPSASDATDSSSNLTHLLDARGLVQPDTAASLFTRTKFATAHDLAGPLQWFFNCVGALFYIMDPDQVQKSIESIEDVRIPLGDIVTNNKDGRTTTIAAELAGMASIGIVHAQLANPATAPPAELGDYFYAVCKLGLDAAIVYNPLRAVKICALIAMYNIIVHATVALAYLDLGISLSRRYGIDAAERPAHLSSVEHDDMWRTYRTLVHLQCWLSASLDFVPDALGTAALTTNVDTDAPPEDMIRRECVKVSIIKAEMLHRVPKTAPVPEDTVSEFQERLQAFHVKLPAWMGIHQLITNEQSDLMNQFRPVIYYVHLFYLSAMMLLSRRLSIAYVALDATGRVTLPPNAHRAIRDGFVAAQQNAVVMESMLTEGKVVQVCWLCIFTSYTAGVMIAYGAEQKAIHGFPFVNDMELLNKCIRVLSYCAQKDAMAGRFCNILMSHLDELRELDSSDSYSSNDSATEASALDEVLFDFETGSSKLHNSARTLLSLIHRPFSGLGDIATRSTLSNRAETTMGTHLEWEWELKGDKCLDNMVETKDVCGTVAATQDAVNRLMSQPDGAAWSVWTPPVGI